MFCRISRGCRRGKCYHCGSGEQVRRNLCVECRVKAFRASSADLTAGPAIPKPGKSVSTPRSGSQPSANIPNPFTAAGGYRYCQGNCSTIPRPLNEFSHGDSKKCNWCTARFVSVLWASTPLSAQILEDISIILASVPLNAVIAGWIPRFRSCETWGVLVGRSCFTFAGASQATADVRAHTHQSVPGEGAIPHPGAS
jgi:hypothetical protein